MERDKLNPKEINQQLAKDGLPVVVDANGRVMSWANMKQMAEYMAGARKMEFENSIASQVAAKQEGETMNQEVQPQAAAPEKRRNKMPRIEAARAAITMRIAGHSNEDIAKFLWDQGYNPRGKWTGKELSSYSINNMIRQYWGLPGMPKPPKKEEPEPMVEEAKHVHETPVVEEEEDNGGHWDEFVARITELRKQGMKTADIAKVVEEEGYVTKYDKPYTKSGIDGIFWKLGVHKPKKSELVQTQGTQQSGLVERLRELRATGITVPQIATVLEREGWRNQAGEPYTPGGVSSMLSYHKIKKPVERQRPAVQAQPRENRMDQEQFKERVLQLGREGLNPVMIARHLKREKLRSPKTERYLTPQGVRTVITRAGYNLTTLRAEGGDQPVARTPRARPAQVEQEYQESAPTRRNPPAHNGMATTRDNEILTTIADIITTPGLATATKKQLVLTMAEKL